VISSDIAGERKIKSDFDVVDETISFLQRIRVAFSSTTSPGYLPSGRQHAS
jgi:hypothetical protein